MKYDVFVSHASEDKADFVRPLANELSARGLKVWFDECQLTVGDSLRQSIDDGLSQSRFGVVVLSPSFFAKEWPRKELDALVAREDGKQKVILPIWHGLSKQEVTEFSPLIASKLAVSTEKGMATVVDEIARAVEVSNRSSVGSNSRTRSLWQPRRHLVKTLLLALICCVFGLYVTSSLRSNRTTTELLLGQLGQTKEDLQAALERLSRFDHNQAHLAEIAALQEELGELQNEFQSLRNDNSTPSQRSQDAARALVERSRSFTPKLGIIFGTEATTDVGDLLHKSYSAFGGSVQRRSPIVTDPRSRGERVGAIAASG